MSKCSYFYNHTNNEVIMSQCNNIDIINDYTELYLELQFLAVTTGGQRTFITLNTLRSTFSST